MTTQAQEAQCFEKDGIKVQVTEAPGCQVKMEVRLPVSENSKAQKDAIKKINKEVSLPGFRKGRAPEQVVLKHYQKYVDQEWKDLLIRTSLEKGLEISGIEPSNQRNLQLPEEKSLAPAAETCLVFSFEKAPQVPEIDLSKLKPKAVKAKSVTKAEAKDYLEEIRLMDAQWEDIKDRGVKKGDYVELDIIAIDETPHRTLCQQKQFQVAKGKMGQWLQDLITDKNVGDEVEGKSVLDPDADKGLEESFRETTCRVTIKAIKKAKLPTVDEDFAKKLGVASVDELNEKIEERLQAEHQHVADDAFLKNVQDELVAKFSFELPASMVKEERSQRLQEKKQALAKEKLSKEQQTKKEKELDSKVDEEVNRSLTLWFIAKKIAAKEKIFVSDQEVSQAIYSQFSQFATQGLNIEQFVKNDNVRSRFFVDLLMHKVNLFLQKSLQESK